MGKTDTKRVLPDENTVFPNIIKRQIKQNMGKQASDSSTALKNFCGQKNISLMDNGNMQEEQLSK